MEWDMEQKHIYINTGCGVNWSQNPQSSKTKINASLCISNMFCVKYDYNTIFWL